MKKKYLFLLILFLVVSIVSYILYNYISDLQSEVSYYKSLSETKDSMISENTKTISEYNNQLIDYRLQISFMNQYIAICPIDGTGLYHKYSCSYLDRSTSFQAYVIPEAERQGFKPCFYCEGNNNIEADTSEVVYITDTGSKYHREWCSYLKSSMPITKKDAISKGYTPCSVCNP